MGPGEAIYHNRHYHRPYRAIADDLVLSRLEEQRALRAGEATAPLAALLIPEQSHQDTPQAELHILAGPEWTACLATSGYLAAASFAPAQKSCVFSCRRPELVGAYAGTRVEIRGEVLEVRIPLAAGSAQWFEAAAMLRVEGDVGVEAMAAGGIYATNLGKGPAGVEIVGAAGSGGKQSLRPGEVKMLVEAREG